MKMGPEKEIFPVIKNLEDFDPHTGSLLERIIFNNRGIVLLIFLIITVILGFQATKLRINANFEKTIPTKHPYIANYLKHKQDLATLGNAVRICVENTSGDIYDARYLETLKQISDEVFLLPGVHRMYMKSLWSSSTRWQAVTEYGFDGGTIIPGDYNGSKESVEQVRRNVERSQEIGQLVAFNHRSSVIFTPLMSSDPTTGEALDYGTFSRRLEEIRSRYQSQNKDIKIHIIGFAKVMGDIIEGVQQILSFFAIAIIIAIIMLYWYSRCIRSTILVVSCSSLGVVWMLGLSAMLGYTIDPYSVLVPFLVFSIAMSHGAQKMNGVMQDIGRGTHRVIAARYTFRRLFLTGLTAVLTDVVGFAVLMLIAIGVIRDLAFISSIGVCIIIFTKLILVPVVLSYIGVNKKAALRALKAEEAGRAGEEPHVVWRFLVHFTQRRWATVAILCGLILAAGAFYVRQDLKIGDLDPGAPELRPDSRYNRDNAFITENYGASTDVMGVMIETPANKCLLYDTQMRVDALGWILNQLDGVDSTNSLPLINRQTLVGFNEGNLKWYDLLHNEMMINNLTNYAPRGTYNDTLDLLVLYAYLKDHKADTLTNVVNTVETFARENNTENAKFLLTAGSAGIEAATNIVVEKANFQMVLYVYIAVSLLSLLTFRSWQAVLCAMLPLMVTSVLGEALMVWLGIGVKVATLPVIALGVGIGVDYAYYLLSVMEGHIHAGRPLNVAYLRALLFTGKVVMLMGLTLSAAVATWAFSPIKFQADMGIMLAFMFLWNMLGTMILLPSLACYLIKPRIKQRELPVQ